MFLMLFYFILGVVILDGQWYDKFEVVQKLVLGVLIDVMVYEFIELYEVVKGEWWLMVFQGDCLLVEKFFDVC